MKKSVLEHCTSCQVCAKHNIKTQQLKNKRFSSPPQPMEFIAMDLIGEFHPAFSKGNRYALTAVCMLTGFTLCIQLKSKHAEDIIKAYINHICCPFGPSRKILTDNGTEFKNKLWTEVFDKLKTEQKFIPIYSPQCNSRIEGFHKFLKATIAKKLETRIKWESHSSIQLFPHRIIRFSTILPYVQMRSSSKTYLTGVRKTKIFRNRQWHDKRRTDDKTLPCHGA